MRPAQRQEPKDAARPAKRKKADAPASPLPTTKTTTGIGHGPPRPIGPEALKALREAIKSGAYPTDQDVMRGLVRMIRKP